jgi:hypothetical protein
MIDNNPNEQLDTRTWNELLNFWDAAGLRAGTVNNLANQANAVQSFELGRTQDYRLYWQMRQRQADPASYNPNFVYSVSASERQALTNSGMDATRIAAFEASRTAQYKQLNAEVGGFTSTYQQAYAYAASTAEKAAMLKGSSWTDRELGISISAGLLKEITNTNPVIKSANVSGRTVTLQAGMGIGESQVAVVVPTNIDPKDLTDAQKVALASAERSDIVVTDTAITVVRRAPLNFAAKDALNVAVTAAALAGAENGTAYLASRGNAVLNNIDTHAATRIKVSGSIVNFSPTSAAVQTGNLILEAANGGIGYLPPDDLHTSGQALPLRLNLNAGSTLTARAADNIDIVEADDMAVDTIYSRKAVTLSAGDAIVNANNDAANNVIANNITLNAGAGSIGTASNALNVGINLDGGITANAGQGVHLHGPLGHAFNIASVTAGDAIDLSADADMKILGAINGPGDIRLAAGRTLTLNGTSAIHAVANGVAMSANTLAMRDGATVTADLGGIDIRTVGDATITGITSGNGGASAVSIVSGGNVIDGGDFHLDVVADHGPAAKVNIQAGGNIGAGNPLQLQLLHLAAGAGGGVDLAITGPVTIDAVQAGQQAAIVASGAITGGSVAARSVALTSTGSSIDLASVNGADGVLAQGKTGVALTAVSSTSGAIEVLSSQGNLTLGSATAAQDIRLSAAQGGIHAAALNAGGSIVTSTRQDTTINAATAAAGIVADLALGNLTIGKATAGKDMRLAAALGAITATELTAGGTISTSAGRDTTINAATAAADIVADVALGDLSIGKAAAGKDMRLAAALGAITATELTAGGKISTSSGRGASIGSATAVGDIALDAGAGLVADSLTSSGGSVSANARSGDVTVGALRAARNGQLTAPLGNVRVGSVNVGADFALEAVADVAVGNGSAGGAFRLSSLGGNATAGSLTADTVIMTAPKRVSANLLRVGTRFLLQGNAVDANVYGSAGSLAGTVTGYRGGMADQVTLTLSNRQGIAFDDFIARIASVDVPLGALSIANARIMDRAMLTNPLTRVIVDQHDFRPQPGADVQLYTDGAPFAFRMFDNHVLTDAFVILRNVEHDALATTGLDRSVTESSALSLLTARRMTQLDPDADAKAKPGEFIPVSYSGFPVSLEQK